MTRFDHAILRSAGRANAQIRTRIVQAPAPGIAKPKRRQNVQGRGLFAAVCRRRADQNVVRRLLCEFDVNVEEALLEHAGVP